MQSSAPEYTHFAIVATIVQHIAGSGVLIHSDLVNIYQEISEVDAQQ